MDLEKAALPPTTVALWLRRQIQTGDIRDEDFSDIRNVMFRFVAGVAYQRDLMRELKKRYPERGEDALRVFAEDLCESLRFNKYAKRIQRAVYDMISSGCLRPKSTVYAKRWAVHLRDVKLTLTSLTTADRKKILKESKKWDFAPPLSPSSISSIAEKVIIPHAKRLAMRKLRFLAMYDQGKSIEDMSSDLTKEGLRTLMHYDHMASEYKLFNYVRRCMHNYMVKIIARETDGSRARLIKVDNNERVYMTTTLSIDAVEKDEENGSLHDVIGSDEEGDIGRQATLDLHDALSKMTADIGAAFLIGMGHIESPEFNERLVKIPGSAEFGVVKRTRLAVEFAGHDWKAVKHNLAQIMTA
jgi:hypothetical protein